MKPTVRFAAIKSAITENRILQTNSWGEHDPALVEQQQQRAERESQMSYSPYLRMSQAS